MKKSTRAFTLVELLITIGIIGILTAAVAVSYNGIRQRARDADRQNDLLQLKINLTSYYQAQVPQRYPVAATKTTLNNTNDPLRTALVPNFAREIPLDPKNTGNYVYKYQSNAGGTDYTLFGTLENINNKNGWGGGTEWVVDGLQIKPD